MDLVTALARKHDLFVVEDCAIAIGSRYQAKHVGLHGDIGCFSFYPVKHITTGEGGMVITTREDVADRVSKQRAFGIDKSVLADRRHTGAYDIEFPGLNYRMGEMGAAMGVEQMRRLDEFLRVRERNFKLLADGLSEIDDLEVLQTGSGGDFVSSHYCLNALLSDDLAARREELIETLKANGLGTSVYYPKSLPDTRYYAETYGYPPGSCAVATRISTGSIAFPVGPHVQEGDVETMIETVKQATEQLAVRG
jgi:dTDP-4-amino-4,6-dideoxygalactose transaminase